MSTLRSECLKIIANLPKETREAIAIVVQTAETQGDYCGGGSDGGSVWCDSVAETLNSLAAEIRGLNDSTN